MSTADYAGSWFASGFFGHNRGRWRNDFMNKYRQLARPQPPDLFLKRLNEYGTKNVNPFSEHDTKQSREFINVSFEHPVSDKVRASKTSRCVNRDVIAWTRGTDEGSKVPCRTFAQAYQDGEKRRLMSSYSETFSSEQPKLIAARPITAYDCRPWTSTYRNAFCNNEPVPAVMGTSLLTESSPVTSSAPRAEPAPPPEPRKQRQQPAESVSSCLVWCDAEPRPQLNRAQVRANTLPQSDAQ